MADREIWRAVLGDGSVHEIETREPAPGAWYARVATVGEPWSTGNDERGTAMKRAMIHAKRYDTYVTELLPPGTEPRSAIEARLAAVTAVVERWAAADRALAATPDPSHPRTTDAERADVDAASMDLCEAEIALRALAKGVTT